MKKRKLFVYGYGKFAEYAAYVFSEDTAYEVMGYCIEAAFLKVENVTKEIKEDIYIFEDLKKVVGEENFSVFIAVGNNKLRKRIFEKALDLNYNIASYISSRAVVWKNLITGRNVFIGEGSVLQPYVEIGDSSIHFITHIGHHTKIGSHTLLSVTTLGGNVEVGDESYLGMNSTVKQNTKIGERSIIGMNVAVDKDTDPDSVYTHRGSAKRDLTYQQVEKRFLQ